MTIKNDALIVIGGIASLLGAFSLLTIEMDINNIKEEVIFIIFGLLTAFGITSLSVVFFNWGKQWVS